MSAPLAGTTRHDARGVTRLHDWGVIRAHGADSRSFLHSQLTQDMQTLDVGVARLAGYCSAKGRLLATFVVWSPSADEVLLACSADLLPTVLKRLSMFVLRAKCKLSDASGELVLWGALGQPGQPGLPAAWRVAEHAGLAAIGLPAALLDGGVVARALLVAPDLGPGAGVEPPGPALPHSVWQWAEVASGVPRVAAATSEHFVPQMVNLELVGGVNFQKGCYPGQEVVARSQYRGTLKRRAYLLEGAAAAQPGQELFQSEDPGQPAGEVVNAASHDGRHWALAELKIAALGSGSLHLGTADGPRFTAGTLPYPIPSDSSG